MGNSISNCLVTPPRNRTKSGVTYVKLHNEVCPPGCALRGTLNKRDNFAPELPSCLAEPCSNAIVPSEVELRETTRTPRLIDYR